MSIRPSEPSWQRSTIPEQEPFPASSSRRVVKHRTHATTRRWKVDVLGPIQLFLSIHLPDILDWLRLAHVRSWLRRLSVPMVRRGFLLLPVPPCVCICLLASGVWVEGVEVLASEAVVIRATRTTIARIDMRVLEVAVGTCCYH